MLSKMVKKAKEKVCIFHVFLSRTHVTVFYIPGVVEWCDGPG